MAPGQGDKPIFVEGDPATITVTEECVLARLDE